MTSRTMGLVTRRVKLTFDASIPGQAYPAGWHVARIRSDEYFEAHLMNLWAEAQRKRGQPV